MLTQYFNDPKDEGENLIIEEMIYMNAGNYTLCGKIDKLFNASDGENEVIDYKTSKTISPIDNIQLPIYLMLVKHRLGFYPNRVSLYYLSKNEKITVNVNDDFIKKSTSNILKLCDNILGENNFQPNPNSYCKNNCQYYEVCDEAKNEKVIVLSSLRKFKKENKNNRIFCNF